MTGQELNLWRKRMKLSLTDAAKALGISRGRLTDCLYMEGRPPSRAVVATAHLIEERTSKKVAAYNDGVKDGIRVATEMQKGGGGRT